jgi:hypothetical protein
MSGQGTFPQQNTAAGTIVGFYVDANNVSHGFVRDKDGTTTPIDVPGAGTGAGQGTEAYGITQARITGIFTDAGGSFGGGSGIHGFVLGPDHKFATFDAPGPNQGTLVTFAGAINAAGTISGAYLDGNNVNHGFVRAANGTITSFDPPGSIHTDLNTLGINSAGTISVLYADANGVGHGAVRAADGTITPFDAPGAGTVPFAGQGTVPESINVVGTITGNSIDANGVNHGFLRAPDGTFTSFDVSEAGTGSGQGTIAEATNPSNVTVGYYFDARLSQLGFQSVKEKRPSI